MTTPPLPPPDSKTLYRCARGPLEDLLRALVPHWRDHSLSITSQRLASNASFVNYVHHHRVMISHAGEPVEIVEKSIKKMAFIGSQEARFHRFDGMLSNSTKFGHPTCLGVVETPWESRIFTTFIVGKPPRMQTIARQLAEAIAEQEQLSHVHLTNIPLRRTPLVWSMDFFHPWFLLRPRFNFERCLPGLDKLGREDERFAGLADCFKRFTPVLRNLANQARLSQKCISHMDYIRKNLFIDNGRLYLIDWSEAKVGRIGFDGGAYLGSLFRRKETAVFLTAQSEFVETYRNALPPFIDTHQALQNQRYIFLVTALYHMLRPETILEYRERDRTPLLLEKYRYLLTQL